MFEILTYKEMFTYFIEKNQSGFKFGDACANQLLPMTLKFTNL